jgi:hypothetical protein
MSQRAKQSNSESALMKFASRVRLMWIFCLVTASASGGQAQTELHEDFICTSASAKRLVSVINSYVTDGIRKSAGCRVDYTKNGETKTVWSSKTDHAYCAAKAASLVTTLAKGNFSCKPQAREQPDETAAPEQPAAAD